MNTLERKAKKRPTRTIKHGRVCYRYQVGLSQILIETDPKTNWPEMPDYYQVCFSIETIKSEWATLKKPEFAFGYELPGRYEQIKKELEAYVLRAIKKRVNAQRKAPPRTMERDQRMGIGQDKSDKAESKSTLSSSARTKRKA